jgi:phosphatidate cytidylyltransferase
MSSEPVPFAKRFAREATAAVGIPLLVWSIGWAPPAVFGTLIALALLGATAELVLLAGRDRLLVRLAPPLAAEAILLGTLFARDDEVLLHLLPLLLCAAAIVFPLVWLWARAPLEGALAGVTAQWAGLFYVGVLGATILRMFLIGEEGRSWVTLLLVATWAGDAAAYYVGRTLGRHRFSPLVSPKKSWEGAIGGAIATVVVTVLLFRFLFGPWNLAFLAAFGFSLAVMGMMGDLVESMFKRAAGVKDSGGLLPGHGGLLDRVDSLLWNGPIVLAVAYWWENWAPPIG